MPNGGHGKVRCIVCGRSFTAINFDWIRLGEPVAVDDRYEGQGGFRYAGRSMDNHDVVCFDCQPATPSEVVKWTGVWLPPYLTTVR